MGMKKVEFEFPEDGDDAIEVEKSSAVTIDLDNPKSHLEEKPAKKPAKVEDDVELEVVDDTPKADRGRKPSDPPEDPTDEELESYSEKVRNRIKHFTKGYHDERRAKEAALREREELERLAKQLMEENRQLKETGTKSQQALLQQAKTNAENLLASAQNEYKKAYSEGDPDKVLAAQEKLMEAKQRLDKVNNYKLPALQTQQSNVNIDSNNPKPATAAPAIKPDEKAAAWARENPWFNKDPEMTSFALGLHQKMVKEGVDPKSDEYYERLNSRMRQVFPEQFDDVEPEPKRKAKDDNVVAPATRSTMPKKIRLTQTQVNLAKRLGLTPEQYAKQVALEMRKNNG